VRNLVWIGAFAQTVHGISVLIDEESTEGQRLQAVFDVAMGSAGLTGAAATLGVEALAGLSGPLTAGILIAAGEVRYLRSQIRGMERGMAGGGSMSGFDPIEYEAGGVAHRANELHEAIGYADEVGGQPTIGRPGEMDAAVERRIAFRTRRLREFLERAIERVTQNQPEMAFLFQPANCGELRAPFVELEIDLENAESPEETLAVAAAYVEAARELFRHFERTLARTLIGVDETREGGVVPSLLGGLHSDLIQQAAAEQR
jgi:hypothetical protein